MNIKILGPGCANCRTLYNRTQEALKGLAVDATLEKVESYEDIARYGILRTPGLVIDEKVVMSGAVPPVDKIMQLVATHLAQQ